VARSRRTAAVSSRSSGSASRGRTLARRRLAFLLLAVAAPLQAQGVGRTAGLLLETPGTARTLGLGGAYAAVVGDAGSIFVNPAGMAPISHIALEGSFEEDFLGSRLTTAAAALRVGRFHVGFGAMLLEFGGDSVIVPDPATGGQTGMATGATITAYNLMGVGALAYRRGMFSLGMSTKFLRERIADGSSTPYTATGLTGDVGFAIAVFDLMALGIVSQNVVGTLTRTGNATGDFPRTTRVGLTMNFIDPQGTLRLMTTADWIHPPGGNSWWALGLEGGVVVAHVGVVGRLGMAMGRADTDRGPITLGGGLQFHGLRLDYGYQGWDVTGAASHRFGVRWIP